MSFYSRTNIAENMEKVVVDFLLKKRFLVEKTGYEKNTSKEIREILGKVHNEPTVRFLRYLPDYFTIFNDSYFFTELKVMNSPILLDKRVQDLRRVTGLNDLSKENIGVVETSALINYENLSQIGVKILVIVYCSFHPKKILVAWEKDIVKFFNDKVRIGQGDASFTPFTNIHLDKMSDLSEFFKKEFKIEITDKEIKSLIENIESG